MKRTVSFSAVRYSRPRVPFWELAAHRIPTLWSLYRGLLKEAPTINIRWRVRVFFEKARCLTSVVATRERLLLGQKYLHAFRCAKNGDHKMSQILFRYDRMIGARREKEEMGRLLLEELSWQQKLLNRSILTGAFLRPSIYNGPLPRLKPQPKHVSLMLHHRRKARIRRTELFVKLLSFKEDLANERAFELDLIRKSRFARDSSQEIQPVFAQGDWRGIFQQLNDLMGTFERDSERAMQPYPAELLEQMKEARQERTRNKTRALQRERRGEVLSATLLRKRKGPPAHILARMSESQRHMDRVARSLSEVGYVAMVKDRLGIKMRSPDRWKEYEEGSVSEREKLDEITAEVYRENERRKTAMELGVRAT